MIWWMLCVVLGAACLAYGGWRHNSLVLSIGCGLLVIAVAVALSW